MIQYGDTEGGNIGIGGAIGAAPSSLTISAVPTIFAHPPAGNPNGGGPTVLPPPPSDSLPPIVTGIVPKPSCGGTCANPNAPKNPTPGTATIPTGGAVSVLKLGDGEAATTMKKWYEGIPWYVWAALALATYSTFRRR